MLALRQNLSARILELEKDHIFTKYKEKVGQIVTGEVYQVWKKEILVLDDEGNELILPKQEQIPSDFFKKGDTIRAVVIRVEMRNASPYIILSRTSPVFLERLFENEVPEIFGLFRGFGVEHARHLGQPVDHRGDFRPEDAFHVFHGVL